MPNNTLLINKLQYPKWGIYGVYMLYIVVGIS